MPNPPDDIPPPDLRRLVDSVPSVLAYWDRNLRCRFANRAFELWFGVDAPPWMGLSMRELLGEALFALNLPHIEAVLRGEAQQFERVVPGPGGVQRHCLAHYLPDLVDGIVVGFTVQVAETTPIKHAEAALKRSEQMFRALSDASPFVVFRTEADGRCTYVNRRWEDISGQPAAQALGQGWLAALHADDRDAVAAAWRASCNDGRGLDLEFRLVRPDGETRVVHSRARGVAADESSAAGFVGALEDVTERRQAEQRLRASEWFLDRTGRVARVGGWMLDLRSGSVTWSAQTRRIHGVGDDYLPSLDRAIAFYAVEARPVIQAGIDDAIRSGTPWDLELPFNTADGRAIWVRASGEAEYESGRPVRLIGAFQDITEQRARKVELAAEHAQRIEIERHALELDRLLRERSEMLDVLAHEVRQPLNNASAALQGSVSALAGAGEAFDSMRLTRARAVIGQVVASIDNTLAVATLLARGDPIQRADTDIDTLVAVAIADMPPAERARVRVERTTRTRTASMDMSLMRLALRNLLSNALRYGAPGSPVTVRLGDSDDPLALVIDVLSSGRAIAAERLAALFERSAPRSRERAGSDAGRGLGLGLYIVRRVMELHGGRAMLIDNTADGVTLRLLVAQAPAD